MKAILAFLTTILLILGQTTQAEISEYETYFPMSGSSVPYPNLDLNGIEKIKVKTSSSIHQPDQELEEIELVFPNATNLVAKNFQKVDGSYSYNGSDVFKTIVNDAWVYSKVLVKVTTNGKKIAGGTDLSVELEVVEMTFELNDPNNSMGLNIFNANGILRDVTPVTIADVESLNYQDDDMTLSLYQRATFDEFNGDGFKIKTNWMGHGERIINVPAPIPSEDYSIFKAAGLEIQTETFPDGFTDHQFRIKYEDPMGYAQYTPFEPLQPYIDQAYQANP
ncbi:hypothetical protein [Kangiella sediminilitoris]|uniref:Uncharacterized protein n=1 Tax=Kangiella sediminilitoris TaxID=1144748 RepID=A0A1B3B8M6_9GAMM|nr:hypothetical protein [Kangiella sediminilitoris]AOE49135.1 hypothetical protein KS2013_411 [Kangiella sediminilitoris]